MSESLKDVFLYSSDSILDVAIWDLSLFLFFGSDAQAASLINKRIKGSQDLVVYFDSIVPPAPKFP